MPTEAINLWELLDNIQKGKIKMDKPLIKYQDGTQEFFVFQDSGLNLLLGHEGNGKTKLLTHNIIQLLDQFQDGDPRFVNWKILYIDAERPETQYAKSLHHIFNTTKMANSEVMCHLQFLSVMDLECKAIVDSIQKHLDTYPDHIFIVIIDPILPLVNDLNSPREASEIDRFIKKMICQGHIVIASIHETYNGFKKGLGHLGSSLQRTASFMLEVANDQDGTGFEIKQFKSRISPQSKIILSMKLDDNGNIDATCFPIIKQSATKNVKIAETLIAKEILEEFSLQKEKSKKQLLLLIAKKKKYTSNSSSSNTYFNKHLVDQVSFETE